MKMVRFILVFVSLTLGYYYFNNTEDKTTESRQNLQYNKDIESKIINDKSTRNNAKMYNPFQRVENDNIQSEISDLTSHIDIVSASPQEPIKEAFTILSLEGSETKITKVKDQKHTASKISFAEKYDKLHRNHPAVYRSFLMSDFSHPEAIKMTKIITDHLDEYLNEEDDLFVRCSINACEIDARTEDNKSSSVYSYVAHFIRDNYNLETRAPFGIFSHQYESIYGVKGLKSTYFGYQEIKD